MISGWVSRIGFIVEVSGSVDYGDNEIIIYIGKGEGILDFFFGTFALHEERDDEDFFYNRCVVNEKRGGGQSWGKCRESTERGSTGTSRAIDERVFEDRSGPRARRKSSGFPD